MDSPYTIQEHEARDCLNVVSTTRGAIRKRTGSTLFTGSPPAVELNSLFAATISGTKWLIAAGGGKIYSISTTGTVVEIGTGFNATARWSMVQAPISTEVAAEGPVYMVNGVDPPQFWSGTGLVKAWLGKNDLTHYALSPYVPLGKYMVFAGNRVWVAGVAGDPAAVWFTELVPAGEGGDTGDPSNWPKTNVIRFDTSDGGAITGIGTAGPYMLVFKEYKTWVVTGIESKAAIKTRRLADNIGCVSHRSIVETTQGTFFLTADQGVYLTDGSHLHEMSYNVRPTILGINPSKRENAAGTFWNNHYYLSFASGASTTNNRTLDYDVQLKSWWLHDLAGNQWARFEPGSEPSLYLARPETTKGVLRAFVPGLYTDAGANYTGANGLSAYWIGIWDVFSYYIFRHRVATPFLKKRVRAIYLDGSGELIALIAKNFATTPSQYPGVVGNEPETKGQLPVNFQAGETTFGNLDPLQVFGGATYQGMPMIFGGGQTTKGARVYAPGVAQAWSVGVGNNSAAGFELDSFAFFTQFRKS